MKFLSPFKSNFLQLIVFLLALHQLTAVGAEPNVRLVLQITVDGLRADLLNRYGDRFVENGFNRFLNEGTHYANAHYQHANTETIVGHTTLATGASPAEHGMTGNVWFDRPSGELAYNIEDPNHPLLSTRANATKGAQVDPAQKLARTQGRSPSAILIPTFGDTLKVFTAGRSKVFGISGKDRSAVALAGKTGKAFWYSTDSGDFVTSTYYYENYPNWVANWNESRRANQYAGEQWELLNEPFTYLFAHQDDRPYETDLKGYGRTFPHPFGTVDHPLYYTRLLVSPIGDQLLSDFAKKLITNEAIGLDDVPDYLSVSFSGVDAVNHFFGPSSLENEDVVLQLDRTLADFLEFIDRHVGLSKTLIVFAADHGMAEAPEYMTELGHAAGRIYPDDIIRAANQAGKDQLGIDDICLFFFRPYLHLNEHKIAAANVDFDKAKQIVAEVVTQMNGISKAVSDSSTVESGIDPISDRIQRNYHSDRSGDIYVVQEPYWFLSEKGPITVMHGSPWGYDTHVPIVFLGPGIKPQKIHREVHPADVAPTLSALMGMSPPAGATGTVLYEATQ